MGEIFPISTSVPSHSFPIFTPQDTYHNLLVTLGLKEGRKMEELGNREREKRRKGWERTSCRFSFMLASIDLPQNRAALILTICWNGERKNTRRTRANRYLSKVFFRKKTKMLYFLLSLVSKAFLEGRTFPRNNGNSSICIIFSHLFMEILKKCHRNINNELM